MMAGRHKKSPRGLAPLDAAPPEFLHRHWMIMSKLEARFIPPVCIALTCILLCCSGGAAAAPKRALEAGDFDRLLAVDGVACSQDGRWMAYTVEGSDLSTDERKTSVWMTDFEGTADVPLTAPGESVSDPKFSPDGRYVSFVAARGANDTKRLFLLDRRGGEAQALPGIFGNVETYAWSPDGAKLVISLSDTGDDDQADAPGDKPEAQGEGDKPKAPAPIVIDRLHFKEDPHGYLTAADRTQLYLYDVAGKKLEPLTTDRSADDSSPVFSPDGKTIAFLSNRGLDAERTGLSEIELIEARPKASPRKLVEFFAPNKASLFFTPDGRRLVYGSGLPPRLNAYIQDHLNVVTVADGKARPLAPKLDRALQFPSAGTDNETIDAILEDDGSEVPVSIRLDSGRVERRVQGEMSATSLCSAAGHVAAVVSTDNSAPEVYAIDHDRLRRLTHHNDALLEEIALAPVEDISFQSRDGTPIHGLMMKPADFRSDRTYPMIIWIHGGPEGQDSHGLPVDTYALELERQWFAAHGYVVLAVNYRGGSGRGAAFAEAIAGDWGHREVLDLEGAFDWAVRERIADPDRLGVGGWSYGGLLTDYLIASDSRFKAAISGAGSGNQISMYGSDEYEMQYNAEIGPPWRRADLWTKISYPFFRADRIKTPTLFIGCDKDFDVPLAGGEQMYQALRTLDVPTQLIIYPGQNHLLTRPSFIRDRLRRYIDWYDRYLKPPVG
jgi:dipeptidyl aminopeptidase/acylaminoacyl peptidase